MCDILRVKALIYQKMRKFSRSLRTLEECIELARAFYGYYQIVALYNQMGSLYLEMGENSEAEDVYEIIKYECVEDNPEIFDILIGVGNYHESKNDLRMAYNLYLNALKCETKVFGEKHPHLSLIHI